MSTTESIASSQTSLSSWRKSDTTCGPWACLAPLSAPGCCFSRIRVGFPGGLIPILVMLVLAYPIAFLPSGPGPLCLSGLTPPAISPKRWKSILAKPAGW